MHRFWIALAGVGMIAACEAQVEMPTPQDGRALFDQNCAVCHGQNGKGQGPLSASLDKAPEDLTTIRARNGGVFPRAKVMSVIDGYAKSDGSREDMPEFGALLQGDLVPFDSGDGIQTPTPRKLVALLEYLVTIQADEQ